MDRFLASVQEKRIERTVTALCKNNFDAHYIKTNEELFGKLDELMPEGISCSVGGSMTLFKTGVIDYLKSGKFNYLDRYAENPNNCEIFHSALSCDVYLTSSNAITEDGKLYNMDGNGNRVAAIVYGPAKVVVIAGANKIVKDVNAAIEHNKAISAPANVTRLKLETPCAKTGFCADCASPSRICCHELISHYQRVKNRITVLILPEDYGY